MTFRKLWGKNVYLQFTWYLVIHITNDAGNTDESYVSKTLCVKVSKQDKKLIY